MKQNSLPLSDFELQTHILTDAFFPTKWTLSTLAKSVFFDAFANACVQDRLYTVFSKDIAAYSFSAKFT